MCTVKVEKFIISSCVLATKSGVEYAFGDARSKYLHFFWYLLALLIPASHYLSPAADRHLSQFGQIDRQPDRAFTKHEWELCCCLTRHSSTPDRGLNIILWCRQEDIFRNEMALQMPSHNDPSMTRNAILDKYGYHDEEVYSTSYLQLMNISGDIG